MASPSAPAEVESLNFEEIGIRWTVRTSTGERVRYGALTELRQALADGQLSMRDELSFDEQLWRPLGGIPDLRAYFWEVFKGVKQGRIQPSSHVINDGDDLIEDDAPTTLIKPDQILQEAIQASLARELAARVQEKNLPPAGAPSADTAPTAPTAAAADEEPAATEPALTTALTRAAASRYALLALGLLALIITLLAITGRLPV